MLDRVGPGQKKDVIVVLIERLSTDSTRLRLEKQASAGRQSKRVYCPPLSREPLGSYGIGLGYPKVRIRTDRLYVEALLKIGCTMICLNFLSL